jgi:hypothetical protein
MIPHREIDGACFDAACLDEKRLGAGNQKWLGHQFTHLGNSGAILIAARGVLRPLNQAGRASRLQSRPETARIAVPELHGLKLHAPSVMTRAKLLDAIASYA